jgi:phosphoglycerate kinase
MKNDEILLLDNLRMCAEENYEFTLEESAKTIMVQRLKDLFDLFVLDSFPSAHRTHPSLVGFAQVLPTCAGKLVEKEVKQLENILTVAKSPFVIVLGGSKVDDRLKALKMLIEKERANHVLLTGIIANVFLRAQGRIKFPLGIKNEDRLVSEAHSLIGEYPDVFSTPVDIAVNKNDERIEIDVRDLNKDDQIFDVGQKTLDYYSKMIFGAGTVFISGPAGFFEKENFQFGTKSLLESVANSMATSIVSGGHLTFALKKYDLADKVNHVSTAGGALVRYITGQKLPMIKCLEDAANGNNSKD